MHLQRIVVLMTMWAPCGAAAQTPGWTPEMIADELSTKMVLTSALPKNFRPLEILMTTPDLTLPQRLGLGLSLRPLSTRELAVSSLALAARMGEVYVKDPQPEVAVRRADIDAQVLIKGPEFTLSQDKIEVLVNGLVTSEVARAAIEYSELPEMSAVVAAHQQYRDALVPAIKAAPEFVARFAQAKALIAQLASVEVIKSRAVVRAVLREAAGRR